MHGKDYDLEACIGVITLYLLLMIVLRIKNIMTHGRCGFVGYHQYEKPIISRYVSFGTRKIMYECKCGKRKSYYISVPFDIPFPIETNDITYGDFNLIEKDPLS